jgi:hypothetical protein
LEYNGAVCQLSIDSEKAWLNEDRNIIQYSHSFSLVCLLLNRPLLPCGVEGSAEPSPSTSILCHNPRFSPVNSSSCHHYTHLFLPRLSRSSHGPSTWSFSLCNFLHPTVTSPSLRSKYFFHHHLNQKLMRPADVRGGSKYKIY